MILTEFIAALVFGLVLVALASLLFGLGGPWTARGTASGFLWFLVVVVLGAWAVGTWTTPVGPVAWGVAWVPFFFGALAIVLLLGALTPRPPATPAEGAAQARAEATAGALLWGFLIVVVVAILLGSL